MTDGPGGRLAGRRLLVLVPEGGGGRLVGLLEAEHAQVEVESLTRSESLDPEQLRDVDEWLDGRRTADWIVLSSAEGVRRLAGRAAAIAVDLLSRLAAPGRLAAIGPATARALTELGRPPDLVADEARSEGLAAALIEAGPSELAGRSILVVRALEGRTELIEALTRAGAHARLAPVYRTVMIPGAVERVARRLGATPSAYDLLVVTSGAPLRSLAGALPMGDRGRISVAALGPVTADVARELGFTAAVTGRGGSLENLTSAIIDHESTR